MKGGQTMKGRIRACAVLILVLPLLIVGCAADNSSEDVLGPEPGQLLAKDGFIAANQRLAELDQGAHPTFACKSCHSLTTDGPVNMDCEDCHPEEASRLNHPVLSVHPCLTCHMPYATLAVAASNKYRADVRTHVVKLRTTTDRKESLSVTQDGRTLIRVGDGLTLDLACYGCHHDEDGIGGNYSQKTMRQLAEKAGTIHSEENHALRSR